MHEPEHIIEHPRVYTEFMAHFSAQLVDEQEAAARRLLQRKKTCHDPLLHLLCCWHATLDPHRIFECTRRRRFLTHLHRRSADCSFPERPAGASSETARVTSDVELLEQRERGPKRDVVHAEPMQVGDHPCYGIVDCLHDPFTERSGVVALTVPLPRP